jgi:hypothetical protein
MRKSGPEVILGVGNEIPGLLSRVSSHLASIMDILTLVLAATHDCVLDLGANAPCEHQLTVPPSENALKWMDLNY